LTINGANMIASPIQPDRLTTARLTLRPARLTDAEALAPLLADWEVARWLANIPHPFTLADALGWVRTAEWCRANGDVVILVVARAEDDLPIGGLEIDLARRVAGYWLGTAHHRRGYGREVLDETLRFAFDDRGLSDLTAVTMPHNMPSRYLLESAGFRLARVEPFDFGLRGGWAPGCVHVITATEWRAARRRSS